MKRSVSVLMAAGAAVLMLSGCATRTVDLQASGATPAGPGLANLYYVCLPDDPGTALYFTTVVGSAEDEYEFPIYDQESCMERFNVKPQATSAPLSEDQRKRDVFEDDAE